MYARGAAGTAKHAVAAVCAPCPPVAAQHSGARGVTGAGLGARLIGRGSFRESALELLL